MRIIAGQHRGRRLNTPENQDIRPTSDKVRQAVFNMLNSRDVVREAVVMDVFCGTGALGIEALSQGASFCYFFDKSKESVRITQDNVDMVNEGDNTLIRQQDGLKLPVRQEHEPAVSLVFLDPPYHQGLVEKAVVVLIEKDWLMDDAYFVIETSKQENVMCAGLNIEQEKTYGDTKLYLASLA